MGNRLNPGCCGCGGNDLCPPTSLHDDAGAWTGWTNPPATGNVIAATELISIDHPKASGNWTTDIEIKSINSSDASRIRVGSACLPISEEAAGLVMKVGESCDEYGIPRDLPFWLRVIADGDPDNRQRSRSIQLWLGDPAAASSARFTNYVEDEVQAIDAQRSRIVFSGSPIWQTGNTIYAGIHDGYELAASLQMPLPTPIGPLSYGSVKLHLYGSAVETDGGVGVSVGVSERYDTTMSNHDPLTDTFAGPGNTVKLGASSWTGTPDIVVGGTAAWHVIDLTSIVAATIAASSTQISPKLFVLIQMDSTDASTVLADAENSRLEFNGRFQTNAPFLEVTYASEADTSHCFRPFMESPITELPIEIEAGINDIQIGQINVRDTASTNANCPSVSCPQPGACVDNTSTADIVLTGARIIYENITDEWVEHQHTGNRMDTSGNPHVATAATGSKRLELNSSALNGTYAASLHPGDSVGPTAGPLSAADQAEVIAAALGGCDFCDNIYWWQVPAFDLRTLLTITEIDTGVAFASYTNTWLTRTSNLMDGTSLWTPGQYRPFLWGTYLGISPPDRLDIPGSSIASVQTFGFINGGTQEPIALSAYWPLKVCAVPSNSITNNRTFTAFSETDSYAAAAPYTTTATGSGAIDSKRWEFDSVVL